MNIAAEKWDKETISKIAETGLHMMDGITTVADVKGISPEELEAVYKVGYANYAAGRYEDAEKVFRFLCILSHTNPKYMTALGSARQARRNFADAVVAYAGAAVLDLNRPKPHYYAAECNLALGRLDDAESGIATLMELCPAGNAENDLYRAKGEEIMKKIKAVRGGQ